MEFSSKVAQGAQQNEAGNHTWHADHWLGIWCSYMNRMFTSGKYQGRTFFNRKPSSLSSNRAETQNSPAQLIICVIGIRYQNKFSAPISGFNVVADWCDLQYRDTLHHTYTCYIKKNHNITGQTTTDSCHKFNTAALFLKNCS